MKNYRSYLIRKYSRRCSSEQLIRVRLLQSINVPYGDRKSWQCIEPIRQRKHSFNFIHVLTLRKLLSASVLGVKLIVLRALYEILMWKEIFLDFSWWWKCWVITSYVPNNATDRITMNPIDRLLKVNKKDFITMNRWMSDIWLEQ